VQDGRAAPVPWPGRALSRGARPSPREAVSSLSGDDRYRFDDTASSNWKASEAELLSLGLLIQLAEAARNALLSDIDRGCFFYAADFHRTLIQKAP
jgi:hypothetical protein